MRRSLTERYDRLEAHGDELAGAGVPAGALPIHTATVDVLSDLFTMSEQLTSSDTPQHLRVMMRMLDKSRPMLLEGLTGVPPASIRAFLGDLVPRLQSIIDTPDTYLEGGTDARIIDLGAAGGHAR
jgi:hypothetical protein